MIQGGSGPLDPMQTTPVSQRELELLRQGRRAPVGEGKVALVVYSRDGARVVRLSEGESLVIGRSRPADVEIRDGSLSRQHACFELRDGRVWVEDLGSTNGTWVGGERVERCQLDVGTDLMLGAATARVQEVSAVEGASYGLVSHDALCAETEAEVFRALAHGRCLSLVMLRSERREPGQLARWIPRLRQQLDPYHRAALYSSDAAEVLLPEAPESAAAAFARRVVEGPDQLLAGVASLSSRVRSAEALIEAAREALERAAPKQQVVTASDLLATEPSPRRDSETGPVLESPRMKELFERVQRLATSSIPVLIKGETGTGKEVVARAIHEGGPRSVNPLVPVNCGAIPPDLVEGTLFGHEKGAFTGATSRSKGVFEFAEGGTVLLDEIGELPPAAQAALLRVLENKRITRVGSPKEVEVDVRVVAATHRDLEAMVEAGEFRRDLLYRLDAMALRIPPLRKRAEDIEPLVHRFVGHANDANGCEVRGVADEAMALLRRYSWPGNVRELRNAVERAVVIAQGSVVDVDDLPERIRHLVEAEPAPEEPSEPLVNAEPAAEAPTAEGDDDEVINLRAAMNDFETELIVRALKQTGWSRKGAAQRLGMPVRTLSHRMTTLGIKRAD